MMHSGLQIPRRPSSVKVVTVFLLASVAVHVLAFAAMDHFIDPRPAAIEQRPIEMVVVEVEPPPPPEPPPPEPPPPERPKPPVRVASVKKAPPPPAEEAPPPPTEEAPPEPEAKPAPLAIGMTMSSTTSAGTFSAPVGNSTYGKVDSTAKAPAEVKPYRAPKYAPIYQVDRQPTVSFEVKAPYTPEARRAGIEGSVLLLVRVNHQGNVESVKLKKGLGYGLDEAALAALKKFRFKPATKNGEPVTTEIPYAYTFYLD